MTFSKGSKGLKGRLTHFPPSIRLSGHFGSRSLFPCRKRVSCVWQQTPVPLKSPWCFEAWAQNLKRKPLNCKVTPKHNGSATAKPFWLGILRILSRKTVSRLKEKECYLAELAGALGVPGASVKLDPKRFEWASVTDVPRLILIRSNREASGSALYFTARGDVTLRFALEHLIEELQNTPVSKLTDPEREEALRVLDSALSRLGERP